MATHSSILAWRIPWTEKADRLQSTGSAKSQTQLTLLLSLILSGIVPNCLVLPLFSCVTLGKLFNHFELQFLHQ